MGYEKCHYVGFGLDTELFKYRDKAHAIKILRNLSKNVLWGDFYSFLENIKKDESVTIGYVGAAEPWWKNTEILLHVFKRLQCQNVSARHKTWLLIVGRSVNKLLSSLSAIPESIKEKIIIIDRISYEAIPYVYNIIDIFVNPSYLDSLEFNTLEALASGIIVLASNRGSIDDLNYFNIDVLKFDPDSDSLLKLLKNVLLDLESFKKAFLTKSRYVKRFAGLEAYALRLKDALNNYIE